MTFFKPIPIRSLLRTSATGPGASARTFTTSSPLSVARIMITGRLANTPELRTTESGNNMILYSVATDSGPRDKRVTSFFRIVSFVANESGLQKYMLNLQKGTLVFVEGDASMRQIEDPNSDRKQNVLNIIQRNIEVLKRPFSAVEDQGEGQNENREPGEPMSIL